MMNHTEKIRRVFNSIYNSCTKAEKALLDEVELVNKWNTAWDSNGKEIKKLDEQHIVLKITIKGGKDVRP